jgi:hypothetical protein
MDQNKLRAWYSHKQGLDGSLAGRKPADVLAATGWARSVIGSGPYLTLFSRAAQLCGAGHSQHQNQPTAFHFLTLLAFFAALFGGLPIEKILSIPTKYGSAPRNT